MDMSCIRRISVVDNRVTYNSYLITGEKTALIDTVPQSCAGEFAEKLKIALKGRALDYVILNHTECDRSGALEAVRENFEEFETMATVAGLKNIAEQLNCEFKQSVVKSGGELKLGEGITLKFLITHNIDWPDSMMTYLCEEKTLFSCDAFSDEGKGTKDYYDRKLACLGEYVNMAMRQLEKLEIERILPGSGEEAENPPEAIKNYRDRSRLLKPDRITVMYESRSGHTKRAAERAFELIKAQGLDARLTDVERSDEITIYENLYSSAGVIFGAMTERRNIPKKLLNIITEMNCYTAGKIKFAAFGSYGWSGEAPNLIYSYLRARHFQTVGAPFRFMFRMTDSEKESFDKYILDFCCRVKAGR